MSGRGIIDVFHTGDSWTATWTENGEKKKVVAHYKHECLSHVFMHAPPDMTVRVFRRGEYPSRNLPLYEMEPRDKRSHDGRLRP